MSWNLLNNELTGGLVEARDELHRAVQLVSSISRSYNPEADDDHYGSLDWWSGGLVGAPVKSEQITLRPKIKLAECEIHLLVGEDVVERLNLVGQSPQIAEVWILNRMNFYGFEVGYFKRELPYQVPPFITDDTTPFKNHDRQYLELARYYENAEFILQKIRKKNREASEIKCWPHHFDIAILIKIPVADQGGSEASIGVGLSPGDSYYDEPYFYVSPWPYPEPNRLTKLKSGGHWHTEDFTAAILTAGDIVQHETVEDQYHIARRFLKSTLKICQELLVNN